MVDSTMYNTTSVLRTMEFLLGLRPMTHFDAGARPMTSVFQPLPDATPYTAEKPRISLTTRNPAKGPGAEASLHMNFDEADENNDDEFNDACCGGPSATAILRSAPLNTGWLIRGRAILRVGPWGHPLTVAAR